MEKDEIIEVVNAAINNSHQYIIGAYQQLFDNSIKAFSQQLAEFEERNTKQHEKIIEHQKETNGRVTNLERETAIIRWACKNPKTAIFITILLFAGIIALSFILGLEKFIKLI